MGYPPGKRHSWYIIAYDYNFHNRPPTFRKEGICTDGDEWHRIANIKQPCNILVKFDPDGYSPPD